MIAEITSLVATSKIIVELLKEVKNLIPEGSDKEDISRRITQAEKDINLAESSAAKDLGYSLCKCTFPPQIMLFDKDRKQNLCSACGNFHDISISSRMW
ncbi:MAG: hypothetical protein KAT04_09750 [Methylococcales bacterium]|nr:hypothetical protein [Methylococcales bacterium]